jgi:1,4-dihydroxy-2-naphthoate octaprenyltransferase
VLAFVFPFLYLLLHFYTWIKMRRINYGRRLNECLGEAARNMFVYGLAVSIGLLLV